jgi:hypothetical protein
MGFYKLCLYRNHINYFSFNNHISQLGTFEKSNAELAGYFGLSDKLAKTRRNTAKLIPKSSNNLMLILDSNDD